MEQENALKILVQAVNVAQKRGAYNLQEAASIAVAVSTFVDQKNVEKTQEVQSESEAESV